MLRLFNPRVEQPSKQWRRTMIEASPDLSPASVARGRRFLRLQGLRPRAPQAYPGDTSRSPREHNAADEGRYAPVAGGW